MKAELTIVPFYGAKLLAVRGETPADTLVAMKPVVEGMGLNWSSQHAKVLRHPVLAKGIQHIAIPSAGGTQTTTALSLTKLNLWLATVHPDKVRADARHTVIRYQEECADVLFAHFFNKAAGGDVPEPLRRIDGIARMLAHKVTLLEKAVDAALTGQANLAERVNGLMLAADPRVAALERISVRQLLDEVGALPRKRNALNRRVGNTLRALALKNAVKGCRRCPHSGVWLFPIDFAREWMRETGAAWVRDHNAAVTGQGVLAFPGAGKRRAK